jgi:type I restriction-modification system DNA methylase subunit
MDAPPAKTFDHGKEEVTKLCRYFATNRQAFLAPGVKEAHVRQSLIDPLFEALGWDVGNKAMTAPQYREVIPEDSLDVEGHQKAPDYTFRVGSLPKFYAEAKKCGVNISGDPAPAYQLRRYGWSAKLALSILTDFEELGVYDCTRPPRPSEKASHARIHYFRFDEYPDRWRELWDVFSREAVWSGAFDQYAASKRKRGTSEVDVEFLKEMESWRLALAGNIALRNKNLSLDDLNAAVQLTIDRVVFLRMAEDRGLEPYEQLLKLCERPDIYPRFMHDLSRRADQKYNSGLFHFQKESGVSEEPDRITPKLAVEDKVFKPILQSLYFAYGSPYQFGVMPVEILGTVYERFLGKVIRLTAGHQAKIEDKPDVRKAGGVYYTPAYIVEYIVNQTVAKQIDGRSPAQLAGGENKPPFRILDMACGSGSFLLGAYHRLLDYCLNWYTEHKPENFKKAVYKDTRNSHWRLTIEEKKRILTTHIFGVDIDPQAVEVTKLSLLLKVLEGETDQSFAFSQLAFGDRALPNLAENIKCGNSLIGPDYFTGELFSDPEGMKRVNPFDWKQRFPHAMKVGGFDSVIGNPPYRMLQPHNTSREMLVYLRSHYLAAEFKIDFFHLFLQRAIDLLKGGGYASYILPTPILNNVYAENLRRWIMDQCCLEQIAIARGRVFADADVHTCVLVLRRETSATERANQKVQTTSNLSEHFAAKPSFVSRTRQATFADLSGCVWNILVNEQSVRLLSRLSTDFVPLEKVATINRGLITGNREKYFDDEKKTDHHVRIIAGSDVHRYHTDRPSEYVLFKRPKRSGGCWDEEVHFAPHKIVVRQICVEPTASILRKPLAVTGNIFTVRGDSLETELYLLGILNSRLTGFFWRAMFADFKTSFPQVTVFSLAQVPIHVIDLSNLTENEKRDHIVALVKSMLVLYDQLAAARSNAQKGVLQRQIDATDAEIDRLVYELYGLTGEEIALVEGRENPRSDGR